jgi:short-subunit dehydrogenase
VNSLSLSGKQVVVAGGSSGLGLHLATEAASRGASVTILGRDREKLQAAVTQIANQSRVANAVRFIQVDVMALKDNQEVTEWLSDGKIDMLINCIGRSDRGGLDCVGVKDFEQLFQENVLATVSAIQCFLPALEMARGCVVNIGSLAGLIATPNMGAYCVTKFALTALSRQWRLELAARGVHVMLVSPGPIQRSDSHSRYNELAKSRGLQTPGATAPGGGAKITLLDPVQLAKNILNHAEKRTPELIVPSKAKWLAAIVPVSSWLADRILSKFLKK